MPVPLEFWNETSKNEKKNIHHCSLIIHESNQLIVCGELKKWEGSIELLNILFIVNLKG